MAEAMCMALKTIILYTDMFQIRKKRIYAGKIDGIPQERTLRLAL